MLCLMAIYKFVGEDVMPLLSDLNPSKVGDFVFFYLVYHSVIELPSKLD